MKAIWPAMNFRRMHCITHGCEGQAQGAAMDAVMMLDWPDLVGCSPASHMPG